jgi:hypothetical protein
MKFLITLSLRDFNKKNKDYHDQKKLIKNILKYETHNIDFVFTQFKEKNVLDLIKIIPKNRLYYVKKKIPKNYKFSPTEVFLSGLKIYYKKNYDYLIWCCSDIIIKKDIFDYLSYKKKESIYTFFPNINIDKTNKTFFGLDFFAFKISLKDTKKLIKVFSKYKNYNWGIFEHFLFSLSTYLKLPIYNLYKYGKIYKNTNLKNKKTFIQQRIEWYNNQKVLEKFLNNKKLSLLYSRGSFYYLAYKLFKFKDINFELFKLHLKLIFYFFRSIIKFEK